MQIISSSCVNEISPGGSCLIQVYLATKQQITYESGTVHYYLEYSDDQVQNYSYDSAINLVINESLKSLGLESVIVTGMNDKKTDDPSVVGASGSSSNPYQINNYNLNIANEVELIYTNNGDNPIKVLGVINTNDVIAWGIDPVRSTCMDNTRVIQAQEQCTLVFVNVLEQNVVALDSLGVNFNSNIILPSMMITDVTIDNSRLMLNGQLPQPLTGNTVYIDTILAMVVNSTTVNNPGTAQTTVTIQHHLINAQGLTKPVVVSAYMDDYGEGLPGFDVVGNCSEVANPDSTRNQECTLTADASGEAVASITYPVHDYYLTVIENGQAISPSFVSIFSINRNNQVVVNTPQSTLINLPAILP